MRSVRGTLKNLKKTPSGESKYDSLLERNYMIELEQDPAVKSWTKEHGIRIPYKFLGIIPRMYHPDFLVEYQDGSKELHEGKGLPLLFLDSTTAKREAAEQWCKEHGIKYKTITRGRQVFYDNNFVSKLGIVEIEE